MVIDLPKPVKTGFTAFQGGGQSLRGKSKPNTTDESDAENGQDDGPLDLPFGTLYFGFPIIPPPSSNANDQNEKPTFTGTGQTLRSKKK